MNVNMLMIIMQAVGFLICSILAAALFVVKPSVSQKYLFEGTVFISINVFGYLVELLSTTEETVFVAVRLQYIGTTMGLLGFLFFICLYNSHIKRSIIKMIKIFFSIVHVGVLIFVMFFDKHNLYYSKIERISIGERCLWAFTPGPGRIFWSVMTWSLGIIIIWIATTSYLEQRGEKRNAYKLIIIATIIPNLAMLVMATGLAGRYDIFPLCMVVAESLLVVTMFRYRLFDTVSIAKERILEELREAIFVMDNYGKPLYYNHEFSVVFPRIISESIQMPQESHMCSEIINFIESQPEGFFVGSHFFEWQKAEILDPKQDVLGILYRIFDMTDNYMYTKKLIELRQDAEKANLAKSSFLANMSHEIRTPINAVLGMNEMILRECKSDNIREYAGNIQNAGKTLLSIVNDILDLSKIESGKMEIVEVDYDLGMMLVDIENMISMRAETKNLKFVIEADEMIPCKLHGDEIRVKQCIINLLTNAVKYTQKGIITMKVQQEKREENIIYIKVIVKDTGMGIKESELPQLFNSFSRLDINKNRNVEGTGLGLSITKNLVEKMGGNIMVESVYGVGSTFSFVIPQNIVDEQILGNYRECQKEIRKNTETERYSYIAPTAKVLAVDDNQVNLAVVKGLLKKLQVKCDLAAGGRECLEKVSEMQYDVIFLDHMMPEMDGVETLREIEKLSGFSKERTAVIALTANALSGAKDEYLNMGFTDYLSKPIDPTRLEELLRKYIPKEKIEGIQ